jgi:hypothetical protein
MFDRGREKLSPKQTQRLLDNDDFRWWAKQGSNL